jgi:hypothetical protein
MIREGVLNARLLKEGRGIFGKLKHFSDPVWARRIGIGKGREMDFVIIDQERPRLGVVECAVSRPRTLSRLIQRESEQLTRYADFARNRGASDLAARIQASLPRPKGSGRSSAKSTRQDANIGAPMTRKRKQALIKDLDRALKGEVTALLLVYVVFRVDGRLKWLIETELAPPSPLKRVSWKLALVAVI